MERAKELTTITMYVAPHVCAGCELKTFGAIYDCSRNDQHSILADNTIPPSALVGHAGLPDGWKRVDPLNSSDYYYDNVYCPTCAPIVAAAMTGAHQRVVRELRREAASA